jgi:hypothetical protein
MGVRARPLAEDSGPLAAPARLHPTAAFDATCPRDGQALEPVKVHLPGWRFAYEGVCPACGHRYVQDLPSGHGLLYPSTIDRDTGELIDPLGATWFARPMLATFERPDDMPVRFDAQRVARGGVAHVLNTLDPVYGHALLRLLAADRLARHAAPAASVVIVARPLAHLVPSSVTERWVVDEPFSRLGHWLLDLEEQLRTELQRFDEARLVAAPVHPHPSTFDLDAFVGDIAPERPGNPSIVLSLREDRRWGADEADERARIAQLVDALSDAYPEGAFAAVGIGQAGGLPAQLADLRRAKPSVDDERRWLALLRGADLAIGVHGSNMLLPSALARATIELLPRSRYANLLQATIVRELDPTVALDRHRTVYGDDDLADVTATRVAEIAIFLADAMDRVDAYFTGTAAGIEREEPPPPRVWSPPAGSPRGARAGAWLGAIAEVPAKLAARVARRPAAPVAERLDGALGALSAESGDRVVRFDFGRDDVLAALAHLGRGDAAAVVVTGGSDDGQPPLPIRELVDRLEDLGLRVHVFDRERLVPARPVGSIAGQDPLVGLDPAVAPEVRERASA